MDQYLLSGYDFDLPEELIAQSRVPLHEERLLYIGQNTEYSDRSFYEMIDTVDTDTVFILNNTKVVKARILLHNVVCVDPEGCTHHLESGEIFVYEILDAFHAEVLVSDGKHFRPGRKVVLDQKNISGSADKEKICLSSTKFVKDGIVMNIAGGMTWRELMEECGEMPLPPYVDKNRADQTYQTEFAQEDGSVAAPTASLRFTQEVLERLEKRGVEYGFVTLHVGLGTFKPLYNEDVRDHELHREAASLSIEFLEQLAQRKNDGKKIVAVGTTVCRVLESLPYVIHKVGEEVVVLGNKICEKKEDIENWISGIQYHDGQLRFFTQLFVYPGFTLTVIDGLLTNFHLPKTSLLVLVATLLGGQKELMEVYHHAIEERYRFYSFGDGMMIST